MRTVSYRARLLNGVPLSGGFLVVTAVIAAASACALAADDVALPVAQDVGVAGQPKRIVGVSACASAGCHGGPTTEDAANAWKSSYTVWANEDPHSRASATLFDKRSMKIVGRLIQEDTECLNLRDPKQRRIYEGHLKQHCAQCHTTCGPGASEEYDRQLFADGVSCESCHGPAGKWLVDHTTAAWQGKADADKYVTWGAVSGKFSWMSQGSNGAGNLVDLFYDGESRTIDTQDLLTRARVCVKCHVGEPVEPSRPRADANHDLIAAGHPRLSFELSTYMAGMPSHWDAQNDRSWADKRRGEPPQRRTRRTDFDAEQWLAGQAVTAHAALQQLQWRAEHANDNGVWPEFSEYDCYACHHDLGSKRYRRHGSSVRSTGRYVWGTWYLSMAPVIADVLNADQASLSVVRLKNEMARGNPDEPAVEKECQRLMESLAQMPLRNGVTKKKLARSIASRHVSLNLNNWDETAQWFLAADAIARTPPPRHGSNATAPDAESQQRPRILEELGTLRTLLQFNANIDPNSVEAKARRYDSPHDYDPRKVQPVAEAIVDALKEFAAEDDSPPAAP